MQVYWDWYPSEIMIHPEVRAQNSPTTHSLNGPVRPWFGAHLHPQPKGWPLGRFNHARDWEWMFFLIEKVIFRFVERSCSLFAGITGCLAIHSAEGRSQLAVLLLVPKLHWASWSVYTDKSPYCEVGYTTYIYITCIICICTRHVYIYML